MMSCDAIAAGTEWDWEKYKTYDIHLGPLSCMCEVEGKLWIGSENYCFIFNLSTKSVEVTKSADHMESSINSFVIYKSMDSCGFGQ